MKIDVFKTNWDYLFQIFERKKVTLLKDKKSTN